jgi:hypothetical protein
VSGCSTVVLVGDKTREIFQPFRGPGYPFAGGGGKGIERWIHARNSGRCLSTLGVLRLGRFHCVTISSLAGGLSSNPSSP